MQGTASAVAPAHRHNTTPGNIEIRKDPAAGLTYSSPNYMSLPICTRLETCNYLDNYHATKKKLVVLIFEKVRETITESRSTYYIINNYNIQNLVSITMLTMELFTLIYILIGIEYLKFRNRY